MRLRMIRRIVDVLLEDLEVNQVASGSNYGLEGLEAAIAAVRQIKSTGVLQEETKAVLSVAEVVNAAQGALLFDSQSAHNFVKALSALQVRASILKEALSDFLGEEQEDLIALGLPEDIRLGGVADTMKRIEKLLEQAFVNPTVGGEVRFLDFDRGSPWLEIALGSTLAVNLLGLMMKLVHEHRAKKQEHETKLLMLQDLKLSVKAREEIALALENELKAVLDDGLNSLLTRVEAERGKKPEPEQRERFRFAVQELTELTERGLQVYPALLAPQETQLLFPDAARILTSVRALLPPSQEAEEIGHDRDSDDEIPNGT